MLDEEEVKTAEVHTELFQRLSVGGTTYCPMCSAPFYKTAQLFQHFRESHGNRLDRLCSRHFELFDSPVLAVGRFCVDCQILRTDTILTADLEETPPLRRFPHRPVIARRRAMSWAEGAAELTYYLTNYFTLLPPSVRSVDMSIPADLLEPLVVQRKFPTFDYQSDDAGADDADSREGDVGDDDLDGLAEDSYLES